MTEIALRDAAVVDLDVLGQGRGQLGGTGEARLRDDLGDAGVEALDVGVLVGLAGLDIVEVRGPAEQQPG